MNLRSSLSSKSESVPPLPFHQSPKLSNMSTVQVAQYGVGAGVGSSVDSGVGSSMGCGVGWCMSCCHSVRHLSSSRHPLQSRSN